MGIYLNPNNGQTKEEWLAENALAITREEFLQDPPKGMTHLAWVDNGAFTACGIGYDARERKAFSTPDDPRPKRYFTVLIDNLMKTGLNNHHKKLLQEMLPK